MMRRLLGAAVAAAFLGAGCLIGIDESKLDRPPSDGGTTGDTRSPDSASVTDAPIEAAPIKGLIGAWSFEEPSGLTAIDSSGVGHDGQLVGPITRVSGFRGRGFETSALGSALGNGSLDVQSLNLGSFPLAGTLSFWYRATLSAAPGNGVIFGHSYGVGSELTIVHLFDPAKEGIEVDYGAPGAPLAQASAALVRGEWNHVIVAWDSAHAALFAGAAGAPLVVQKTTFATAFVPSNEIFNLGWGVIGTLDEASLYDRFLDDAEVRLIP